MPGFDGTGPQGRGPRTGRGFGRCGGGTNRGVSGSGYGRSWFGRAFDMCRRGFGRGRKRTGFGRSFFGNNQGSGRGGSFGARNW